MAAIVSVENFSEENNEEHPLILNENVTFGNGRKIF